MFEKVHLRTARSPDALRKLLVRLISETGADGSVFLGSVGSAGFQVRGVIAYGSTYLPVMRGRILDHGSGSELELVFRPHRQVLVFFSIWFTFLFLAAALIVSSSRLPLLAAPLLLGLLSWMLAVRVFRIDCRWVVKALEENLEDDEKSEKGI